MGILEMTYVSYFWSIIAVLSGIAAVVLFFAYDIRRCWRIVHGKQALASFASMEKSLQHDRTWRLASEEKTEPLSRNTYKATVLLTTEETKPLETMCLLQDITMIEVDT